MSGQLNLPNPNCTSHAPEGTAPEEIRDALKSAKSRLVVLKRQRLVDLDDKYWPAEIAKCEAAIKRLESWLVVT